MKTELKGRQAKLRRFSDTEIRACLVIWTKRKESVGIRKAMSLAGAYSLRRNKRLLDTYA